MEMRDRDELLIETGPFPKPKRPCEIYPGVMRATWNALSNKVRLVVIPCQHFSANTDIEFDPLYARAYTRHLSGNSADGYQSMLFLTLGDTTAGHLNGLFTPADGPKATLLIMGANLDDVQIAIARGVEKARQPVLKAG
jgi:hypothetical protein